MLDIFDESLMEQFAAVKSIARRKFVSIYSFSAAARGSVFIADTVHTLRIYNNMETNCAL